LEKDSSHRKKIIIDLHLNGGSSTRHLSSEFGIARATIQNWLMDYREKPGEAPLPNNMNKRKLQHLVSIKNRDDERNSNAS